MNGGVRINECQILVDVLPDLDLIDGRLLVIFVIVVDVLAILRLVKNIGNSFSHLCNPSPSNFPST